MGKTRKIKFFEDLGLCISSDGSMAYGHERGALRWAPMWVKHIVCRSWNLVNCAFHGHDKFAIPMYEQHLAPGPPRCCNCLTRLKINGRYPTKEQLRFHDSKVEENFKAAWVRGSEFPHEFESKGTFCERCGKQSDDPLHIN